MTVDELRDFLYRVDLKNNDMEVRIDDDDEGFYKLVGAWIKEDHNGEQVINLVSDNEA